MNDLFKIKNFCEKNYGKGKKPCFINCIYSGICDNAWLCPKDWKLEEFKLFSKSENSSTKINCNLFVKFLNKNKDEILSFFINTHELNFNNRCIMQIKVPKEINELGFVSVEKV